MDFKTPTTLGRTGLKVSRIGIGAGYGAPAAAIEKAYREHGVNYFYWTNRKPGMREAIRALARSERDRMVVVIQSYDHLGWFLRRSVEKALGALGLEHADILTLGWHNRMPNRRLLDAAQSLRAAGKVRFLGITGHNRKFFGALVRQAGSPIDVVQVRYNAEHRGAEEEVFPFLPAQSRPGVTTYTATSWRHLLNPKRMPAGERPLTAAECYRFVLSSPHVDLCMVGPADQRQMDEALTALDLGPLSPEELVRIRRIGDWVHGKRP